jgi:hypothetical protein
MDDTQKLIEIKNKLLKHFSDMCGEQGCDEEIQTRQCVVGPRLFIQRYKEKCLKVRELNQQFQQSTQKSKTEKNKLMSHFITNLWKYEKLKMKHVRLLEDFQTLNKILDEVLTKVEQI